MRAVSFLALLVGVSPVLGHFHIFLPATPSGEKETATSLRLAFGHPFEHQLFDCAGVEKLLVRSPDGKVEDLTAKVEKISIVGFEGKKVAAYELPFKPAMRGDYVFLARMKPVWMEEEGALVEDTVRVVLHVQAQKGWDEPVGTGHLEWLPLTRPYGLAPGSVFQAVIRREMKLNVPPVDPTQPALVRPPVLSPVGNALVEIERYNAAPPKAPLPPDEFVTRTVKTAADGIATTTLPEAGWWSVTTSAKGTDREHEGKKVPVRVRSTIWVHVSEPK